LAAKKRWGSEEDCRVTYDGQYCPKFATIEEMGISDGDSFDFYQLQRGGKPVIYLFSPKTLEAEVKISLIPQWIFSAIYPVVPIKPRTVRSNEQVAWRVRTHANGDLTELTTGLNVTYLFWEAQYVLFFSFARIPF
jgi:hypothetical protein